MLFLSRKNAGFSDGAIGVYYQRKFLGTFVPGIFRTWELSFPLSDRPSRRFALCA